MFNNDKLYDFVAIDFETATKYRNSACSIGIAMVKDLEVVDTYYTLIKPPSNIYDPTNIRVHGIKPEDTVNAPSMDVVAIDIFNIISESYFVIAHNARFDLNVLHNSSSYKHVDDFRYLDSIEVSNPLAIGISGRLSDRARYFGVKNTKHHNALNDAIVCAQIVISCLEKTEFSLFEYLLQNPSIRIYNYSVLYQPASIRNPNYEQVDLEVINKSSVNQGPFAGKIFIFTGEFKSGKQNLMEKVAQLGGIIKASTVKNTDFCVVGTQDPRVVPSGLSGKHRKALELIAQGSKLKVLKEDELLRMITNEFDWS